MQFRFLKRKINKINEISILKKIHRDKYLNGIQTQDKRRAREYELSPGSYGLSEVGTSFRPDAW